MESMSKRTNRDRISTLPDPVLFRILGFLNMEEIVKTSILSKKWHYIWTNVPTLTFNYVPPELSFEHLDIHKEKMGKFVSWINTTLLLCPTIQKFHVKFIYNNSFARDIDAWVRFAEEKKLEDMSLHLDYSNTYILPQSLCHNSSLTNLSISGCRVENDGDFSWPNLKSLSISDMTLNDDTIIKILSGSPMLEYLKISSCNGINGLYIKSESLQELVINNWLGGSIVEISAPNIRFLRILGRFQGEFQLSVPSLVKADLNFWLDYKEFIEDCEKQRNDFMKIIESILHVVELELGIYCIRFLSLLEEKTLSSPFFRLTSLKLNGCIDKLDIIGIISLLKCSPNLEKLVVNKKCGNLAYRSNPLFRMRVKKFWETEKKTIDLYVPEKSRVFIRIIEKSPLPHLKTVKFNGFKEMGDLDEFRLTFVEFLLVNARLVENVVINLGQYEMLVTPRVGVA